MIARLNIAARIRLVDLLADIDRALQIVDRREQVAAPDVEDAEVVVDRRHQMVDGTARSDPRIADLLEQALTLVEVGARGFDVCERLHRIEDVRVIRWQRALADRERLALVGRGLVDPARVVVEQDREVVQPLRALRIGLARGLELELDERPHPQRITAMSEVLTVDECLARERIDDHGVVACLRGRSRRTLERRERGREPAEPILALGKYDQCARHQARRRGMLADRCRAIGERHRVLELTERDECGRTRERRFGRVDLAAQRRVRRPRAECPSHPRIRSPAEAGRRHRSLRAASRRFRPRDRRATPKPLRGVGRDSACACRARRPSGRLAAHPCRRRPASPSSSSHSDRGPWSARSTVAAGKPTFPASRRARSCARTASVHAARIGASRPLHAAGALRLATSDCRDDRGDRHAGGDRAVHATRWRGEHRDQIVDVRESLVGIGGERAPDRSANPARHRRARRIGGARRARPQPRAMRDPLLCTGVARRPPRRARSRAPIDRCARRPARRELLGRHVRRRARDAPSAGARSRRSSRCASPKSVTRTRPSRSTSTFSGLKSRWTRPAACAAASPRPRRDEHVDDLAPRRGSRVSHAPSVVAFDELHRDEERAVEPHRPRRP